MMSNAIVQAYVTAPDAESGQVPCQISGFFLVFAFCLQPDNVDEIQKYNSNSNGKG